MPDIYPLGARLFPITPDLSEYLRNEFPREDPAAVLARLRGPGERDARPLRAGQRLRAFVRRIRGLADPVDGTRPPTPA